MSRTSRSIPNSARTRSLPAFPMREERDPETLPQGRLHEQIERAHDLGHVPPKSAEDRTMAHPLARRTPLEVGPRRAVADDREPGPRELVRQQAGRRQEW